MYRFTGRCVAWMVVSLGLLLFAGCKTQPTTVIGPIENVNNPTEGWGLQKLDPKDYPDMREAWMDKTGLEQAINKSLVFLGKTSSQRFYPSGNRGDTITHQQIVATLNDMKGLLHRNITPDQFQQEILSRYDVYTSVGYNGKGDVWFTGYFTPEYLGSRVRTAQYQYPIYRRPDDLHADPITGAVQGTYPTRQEMVTSGKLRGLELLWFRKPLEPFMIQVQGSAQVRLPTGEILYVGFAGSNGREHKGLGTQLLEAGKLDAKHLSLPAVIAYYDQHPGELDQAIMKDDRFTFQKIYTTDAEKAEWPTGSLNVQVTPDRSIATDKNGERAIFPRASMTFLAVDRPNATGEVMPYKGLLLDQDNGGGIRAAGRADIYMGKGEAAGHRAGMQFAQGRLYYVFLKPELAGPASAPNLQRTSPTPRGVTPGTNGTRPTAPRSPAGGDEMFPGAVRRP